MTVAECGEHAELALLQTFELRRGRVSVPVPENVQRLLAYLALRSRPQHRSAVAGNLWMDTSIDRAAANLRSALWRTRRLGTDLVTLSGDLIAIGADVQVDFREMLARARQLEDCASVDPMTTAACFADDLLPDWYDDWVLLERERVRQVRLHSLELLAVRLSAIGRHGAAVDAALAAVAGEPLRESARGVLMRAHIAEGNFAEAVREYDAFAELLSESLGVQPTPQLRELIQPCR